MLGPDDALPFAPRRILIAGVTGVGKTTLARRLATLTGSPHTEIDALYHGPNWSYRETFLDEVTALAASDAWITEWQYRTARPVLTPRAELLIWLDPASRVALPRLIRRTIRRRLRREVLWNGNVEGPLWKFFTGRDHIVRWALTTQHKYKESVPALEREHPGLVLVRLRSDREKERWLAGPLADALSRS
jgi:adenylate kinase family enzyme